MSSILNAKMLRQRLGEILHRVSKGERFTVTLRGRRVCQLVPLGAQEELGALEEDPLYRAGPLGRSKDRRSSSDHDELLYGWRR